MKISDVIRGVVFSIDAIYELCWINMYIYTHTCTKIRHSRVALHWKNRWNRLYLFFWQWVSKKKATLTPHPDCHGLHEGSHCSSSAGLILCWISAVSLEGLHGAEMPQQREFWQERNGKDPQLGPPKTRALWDLSYLLSYLLSYCKIVFRNFEDFYIMCHLFCLYPLPFHWVLLFQIVVRGFGFVVAGFILFY